MTKPKLYFLTIFCIFIQAGVCIIAKYLFQIIDNNSYQYYLVTVSGLAGMGLYAVAWQYVLKQIKLSIANAMMSIVPVLTLAGGGLFFEENISIRNYIGICIIVVGLIMISQTTRDKGIKSVI